MEEFRTPIAVQQFWSCQSFGHSAKTRRSKTKCVICWEGRHHKGFPNKEKNSPNAPIVKAHTLHPTKGVQHTKNRHLGNMWWTVKNRITSILRQTSAPPQPQDKAFTFSEKQLIKFEANVAIQVAQPQVCYANPNQGAFDKRSSLCGRVSEAAKNHLGVDINGVSLFDAIGQLCPSAPPASKPKSSPTKSETSFKFTSSTKITKLSAILKSLSNSPPSPSSSTSKVVLKQPKPSK